MVAALLLVFTLLLADFFDTMGTMTASATRPGCSTRTAPCRTPSGSCSSTRSPRPPAALAAVSSNTSYIESASGIGEGARTGLASVVTGVLFLLAMFLAPLAPWSRPRPPRRRWCSSAS